MEKTQIKRPDTPLAATPDSTFYYGKKAYDAGLRYQTASGLPEMNKQANIQDKALADKARQVNKGKKGYDGNGYPLKKK